MAVRRAEPLICLSGAMDDGGGAMISWTVLSLLHALGIRPKRTVRCVLWSCEEFGGIGADQYFQAHEDEVATMSLVMESDAGVFHPRGLEFQGNAQAQQVNDPSSSNDPRKIALARSYGRFLGNCSRSMRWRWCSAVAVRILIHG